MFGSTLWTGSVPSGGKEVSIEGAAGKGIVHKEGMLVPGNDGKVSAEFEIEIYCWKLISRDFVSFFFSSPMSSSSAWAGSTCR